MPTVVFKLFAGKGTRRTDKADSIIMLPSPLGSHNKSQQRRFVQHMEMFNAYLLTCNTKLDTKLQVYKYIFGRIHNLQDFSNGSFIDKYRYIQ